MVVAAFISIKLLFSSTFGVAFLQTRPTFIGIVDRAGLLHFFFSYEFASTALFVNMNNLFWNHQADFRLFLFVFIISSNQGQPL